MAKFAQVRCIFPARLGLGILTAFWLCILVPMAASTAPYAALVMDARTGEVLHSRNADTRLHPASLTKMMTLYIVFEAVRNGEISLDTKVKISRNAASEPPSKLGLRTGQTIALRYLIRAAAVKSANDAATALGEAISGSEAAFARRMTRTAKSLGMTRTTFRNAHGLTQSGHMSTARDMTTLGRHILYDYPEYYNLFSRRSTDAGVKQVNNTNRRLLAAYRGADGIKTGYTNAAGFNLVASAKRGNERIIATVFGGKSTASRNAKVADLLDLGFRRAPSQARLRRPGLPQYVGNIEAPVVASAAGSGKTVRPNGLVTTSLRPKTRPAAASDETVLRLAEAEIPPEPSADPAAASPVEADQNLLRTSIQAALAEAEENPVTEALAEALQIETATLTETTTEQVVAAVAVAPQPAVYTGLRPTARPANLRTTPVAAADPVVVTRLSTSGGRHWGINVGRFNTRYQAEKVLLRTALAEMETLDGSLRKVAQSNRGFEANFLGMTQEGADLACRRLSARNVACTPIGPS
ncbi:D-alanyl-D-alanine carboxypeptidase family protein [Parasedimentitalea maritima]|uniref:D-alanyl-D-alanine carboxypeptidase n=1 Tax=Parasedimentitalea maritima TaxID=2578117 RepID=A0A6A4RQU7_9RHOB|nr:D-alanyl-D-alanine carboxypeptidase [Zongyanglinia marina]